ncbi:MAG: hypothetical protein M3R41_06110 [Pseudomonadota bacterium]|nr:hypothetical protein [Pseudomonadota bacterium]
MKRLIALALIAGTALGTASVADARQGCGRGAHRGPYGHCRVNYGNRGVIAAPGVRLVIGNYYHHRGYWDGRRYWQRRERWHGGWRYR